MGRRMDLIISGDIVNEKGKTELIEVGTIEIKKENVNDAVANAQLNKNIRINKSILKRLNNHIHHQDHQQPFDVLGLDIKGENGFIYVVKLFKDVITATRTVEEPMFIPIDEADFEEFLFSSSLDQLINYRCQYHVSALCEKVNKASKKHKRLRATKNCTMRSDSCSPPLSPIPVATFYTPKRPTRPSMPKNINITQSTGNDEKIK